MSWQGSRIPSSRSDRHFHDLVGGQMGPLVAPGTYTVAMLYKSDTLRQKVEVRVIALGVSVPVIF